MYGMSGHLVSVTWSGPLASGHPLIPLYWSSGLWASPDSSVLVIGPLGVP